MTATAQPAGDSGAPVRRGRLAGVPLPGGIQGARDRARFPRRDGRSPTDRTLVVALTRTGTSRSPPVRPGPTSWTSTCTRTGPGSPRSTGPSGPGWSAATTRSSVPRRPGCTCTTRAPDQRNGSIRGQHVDFRSQGGYVVAPPSRAGGAQYVVVKHEPATGATVSWDAIRGLLEPQPQPGRQPGGRARGRDTGTTSLDRLVEWTASARGRGPEFPAVLRGQAGRAGRPAGRRRGGAVRRRGPPVRPGGRGARGPAHDRQRAAGRGDSAPFRPRAAEATGGGLR